MYISATCNIQYKMLWVVLTWLPCFRYEFVTGSGTHAVMAAAASKGQVYVAGGTAPNAQWPASAPALRQAVQSFKLN